jgi:hypothetical protein
MTYRCLKPRKSTREMAFPPYRPPTDLISRPELFHAVRVSLNAPTLRKSAESGIRILSELELEFILKEASPAPAAASAEATW